jgi:two-component system CitB family sensor kinase
VPVGRSIEAVRDHWFMRRLVRRRLSSQIFAFQALILVVTLLVGVGLALYAAQHRLDNDYEHRALGVAQSVAAMPQIAHAVAANDRSGIVQRLAERVRLATGVAFVVVTDGHGIRFSHPNASEIGKRVSTSPAEALAGRTVLAVQKGTLGRSARAKVPLRADNGRIVGEVSVGVLAKTIRHDLGSAIPVVALYGAVALAVGLLASLALAARLKRQTFGLELSQIADLLQERQAMLHGIREGVVGIDARGRLSVMNDEAQRLLGLPGDALGRPFHDVVQSGRLEDLLAGRLTGTDLLVLQGDRVLVANRVGVNLDGRDLGAVVTLRDRTELEALVRELDSVRSLTDAMRAQAHEFSNRLHTISGLLQLGHYDEAAGFIKEISHGDSEVRESLTERVADPVLAALLLAKAAVAAERGVDLRLEAGTRVGHELADPRAALTVLGNLIDNALDAAPAGTANPPWVELLLRTSADGLKIRVEDSGPGVPSDLRETIFDPGYSTKSATGIGARGVGLSLVRQLAERRGGTVTVADGREGALFEARLPVRLPRESPAPAEPVTTPEPSSLGS